MNPRYPDRVHIAHLPTPVESLTRLSQYLGGPKLYIKRDDQTGLATGGNKSRKLEYLVADATRQDCDYLITTGGPQSNHCRQTAAAAARMGLGCSLVLRGLEPKSANSNLLLDKLLGADLRWAGDRPVSEVMVEVADSLKAAGHHPYMVPLGGSNVIGASGYVLAMKELMDQLATMSLDIDVIVVASSSAGTQAGMVLGARIYDYVGRILGISVDQPAPFLRAMVTALTTATAMHLGLSTASFAAAVEVNDDYISPGYGVLSDGEREAIRLTATLEGIILDPVYTGRAMGGLVDLVRSGAFTEDQTILFWHTGGTPAIFADDRELI